MCREAAREAPRQAATAPGPHPRLARPQHGARILIQAFAKQTPVRKGLSMHGPADCDPCNCNHK